MNKKANSIVKTVCSFAVAFCLSYVNLKLCDSIVWFTYMVYLFIAGIAVALLGYIIYFIQRRKGNIDTVKYPIMRNIANGIFVFVISLPFEYIVIFFWLKTVFPYREIIEALIPAIIITCMYVNGHIKFSLTDWSGICLSIVQVITYMLWFGIIPFIEFLGLVSNIENNLWV